VSGAEHRQGLLFAIAAYVTWGMFPLYWPLLRNAGAVEILAHRIVWSLAVVALTLTVLRRWRAFASLLRPPRQVTRHRACWSWPWSTPRCRGSRSCSP
jgi:chloramphenicol-sensitive protein RarD